MTTNGATTLKRNLVLTCISCYCTTLLAAHPTMIWQASANNFHQFSINNSHPYTRTPVRKAQLLTLPSSSTLPINTLKLQSQAIDSRGVAHVRYNQYFHGIPVFGKQVIAHIPSNQKAKTTLSGQLLLHIEKDHLSLTPTFSATKAYATAKQDFLQKHPQLHWQLHRLNTPKLVIYQTKKEKSANLCYLLHFTATSTTQRGSRQLKEPTYLINAYNHTILATWNALQNDAVGQGPGGWTAKTVPSEYPPQLFQFGNSSTGESFGNLDITVNSTCSLKNNHFIINETASNEISNAPISINDEPSYPAATYTCAAPNYFNPGTATNGARAPSNNALYFSSLTKAMYQTYFGIASPFGSQTIGGIYVYTHITNYDNAVAFGPIYNNSGTLLSHQQIWIGDGDTIFMPLASPGIVAHELSHIFTDLNAALIYSNQSGGVNEAFSDIMAMAMKSYLNSLFSWYRWGSLQAKWQTGFDITIGNWIDRPLRYFYDPTLDGVSIKNFANYSDGMDVHYSSGIFNYAFYLMSTQYLADKLNIQNVAKLFVNANRYYWVNNSTFSYAACGVIQSAHDLGYTSRQITDITHVFHSVGTPCNFNPPTEQPS